MVSPSGLPPPSIPEHNALDPSLSLDPTVQLRSLTELNWLDPSRSYLALVPTDYVFAIRLTSSMLNAPQSD